MQKKLIALAVAGFASTAAFAQSNVTIYGVVDASVDVTKSGDTAAANSTNEVKVSSNTSRIGFKGSEDLGDGLKAIFQLETAFNSDGTATTSLNSRNTFVGLAGDSWGQIIGGQYDTPFKTATRSLDMFADHLGDARNLMGGVAGKSSVLAFDGRPANTIRFDSADYSGFKFALAYVAGAEGNTLSSQTKGKAWSANGTYTSGPWYGTVAYERHTFGTSGVLGSTLAAPVVGLEDQSEHASKLGLGYKDGPYRIGFVYETTGDDFGAASLKHHAWSLGGGYTFGNNEIKAQYVRADKVNDTDGTQAKQFSLGIDHILSKRTKVYAEYTKLRNDSLASYGLVGAGGNNTAGTAALGVDADPSSLQVGVKHSF